MAKFFLVAERDSADCRVVAFRSEALPPLARARFRPGQSRLLLGVSRGAFAMRIRRCFVRRLGLTASLGAVILSRPIVLLAVKLGGGVM